ncbi:MAG: D-aminoacyl-tRNA deacylase [Sphaerochaetaceae bacterium]|nr:D-aminoacyl-tRNA deacylase [Sphaerochaetaceae bacterium]
MKCVIQRVKQASVSVEGQLISEIDNGLLIYFGVEKGDDSAKTDYCCNKISKIRLFEDENGKQNLSVKDVGGQILVVSQFTLCASLKKGNRPSYDNSENPEIAKVEYERAISNFKNMGFDTKGGVFGAHMMVKYVNDGPMTLILEK